MQVQDFVKTYQAKSDEELLQLVAVSGQLAVEARLALEGEMSRRAICIAENSDVSPHDGDGHDVRRSTPSERLQTVDRESEGNFVAEVLRTYRVISGCFSRFPLRPWSSLRLHSSRLVTRCERFHATCREELDC